MTADGVTRAGPTDPGHDEAQAVSTVYQVLAQHWAHAEQIRWTLLYNYSMASTILLLAWAAMFTAASGAGKRIVLLTLAAAGFLVTLLWLVLQIRANGFVHMYESAALEAERQLAPSFPGSFQHSQRYRNSFGWIKKNLGTRRVAPIVLGIFAILYLVLFGVCYAS